MKARGLFYSLAVLVLLAPLIFIIVSYRDVAVTESASKTNAVISFEVKNFIESSESDFKRALEIGGKSAVASAINYVIANNEPLQNSTDALQNLILNGTLNGQYLPLMSSNTISNWTSKLGVKGSKYFMSSTIVINYVFINQTRPFYLDLTASFTINSTIVDYQTKISKTYVKTVQIPIEGIEDPLYPLNSNGLIERSISSNNTQISGVNALDNFVSSKQYTLSTSGPSFLDRLEGKTTYTQGVGIESIININEFIAQGLTIKEGKTMVDYIYFSNASSLGSTVSGSVFPWLLLDAQSKTRYDVN